MTAKHKIKKQQKQSNKCSALLIRFLDYSALQIFLYVCMYVCTQLITELHSVDTLYHANLLMANQPLLHNWSQKLPNSAK